MAFSFYKSTLSTFLYLTILKLSVFIDSLLIKTQCEFHQHPRKTQTKVYEYVIDINGTGCRLNKNFDVWDSAPQEKSSCICQSWPEDLSDFFILPTSRRMGTILRRRDWACFSPFTVAASSQCGPLKRIF